MTEPNQNGGPPADQGPLVAVSGPPPPLATGVATALSDPLQPVSQDPLANPPATQEVPVSSDDPLSSSAPPQSEEEVRTQLAAVDVASDDHPLSASAQNAPVSDEVQLEDHPEANARKPAASQPARQLSSLDASELDVAEDLSSGARVTAQPGPRLVDPVEAFLGQPLPPRYMMPVEEAPADPEGLRLLADNGNWSGVISLSEQCAQKPHHPHEGLQIQQCRLVALTKLHRHRAVLTEFENIGDLDSPQLQFQAHPDLYPGQTGSMVPFAMRVMFAELPARLGNVPATLDRLWSLASYCQTEMKRLEGMCSAEAQAQRKQSNAEPQETLAPKPTPKKKAKDTEAMLDELEEIATSPTRSPRASFCSDPDSDHESQPFLQLGSDDIQRSIQDTVSQWKSRVVTLQVMTASYYAAIRQYTPALNIFKTLAKSYPQDPMLATRVGRMYLETGDLKSADAEFAKAESLLDAEHPVVHMNKGFSFVAQGNYPSALDEFESIIKKHPSHLSAANNFAISLLYTCQLRKAITFLEDMVKRDPYHSLHESVVMNLCTLYELASDRAKDQKRVLQEVVHQYAPQSFNVGAVFS